MVSINTVQPIHLALIQDVRRLEDKNRGGFAWATLPWLDLSAQQITDLFAKWIELSAESALEAFEDENFISILETADRGNVHNSVRNVLLAAEEYRLGSSINNNSCWSGAILQELLKPELKAIAQRSSQLNAILSADHELEQSEDQEELYQARESIQLAILSTHLEKLEHLRSARSYASSFLNRLDGNDSLFCQWIIGLSHLLSPGQEPSADPYFQRARLLSRAKYPEIWDQTGILRGFALLASNHQENFEYSFPTGELLCQDLLFQIAAIHLAIEMGNRVQAKKWIHHLVSLKPISVIFLLGDPLTRRLTREIVEAFAKLRPIGRGEVTQNYHEWCAFTKTVQEAERLLDKLILEDREFLNVDRYDRTKLVEIPVLDLEPIAISLKLKRIQLEQKVCLEIKAEHSLRMQAVAKLKDQFQTAKTQRDQMIKDADSARGRIMMSLNHEMKLSELEGLRAEKGCFLGLASASIIIVGYIAFALLTAGKGSHANWNSPLSKLCFFSASAPMLAAGAYQFIFVVKRFILTAQISQQTKYLNKEFHKAREAANLKYDAQLKSINERIYTAEQDAAKANDALKLFASAAQSSVRAARAA